MSCSFCGRDDSFIYLVCEGQCLICVNCIHQSSIQRLFLECARFPPPKCPLCESVVTKQLKQMIDVFEKDDHQSEGHKGVSGNNWSGAAREIDFSEEESLFAEFMRNFR